MFTGKGSSLLKCFQLTSPSMEPSPYKSGQGLSEPQFSLHAELKVSLHPMGVVGSVEERTPYPPAVHAQNLALATGKLIPAPSRMNALQLPVWKRESPVSWLYQSAVEFVSCWAGKGEGGSTSWFKRSRLLLFFLSFSGLSLTNVPYFPVCH